MLCNFARPILNIWWAKIFVLLLPAEVMYSQQRQYTLFVVYQKDKQAWAVQVPRRKFHCSKGHRGQECAPSMEAHLGRAHCGPGAVQVLGTPIWRWNATADLRRLRLNTNSNYRLREMLRVEVNDAVNSKKWEPFRWGGQGGDSGQDIASAR